MPKERFKLFNRIAVRNPESYAHCALRIIISIVILDSNQIEISLNLGPADGPPKASIMM
jgi:hypothetical protein